MTAMFHLRHRQGLDPNMFTTTPVSPGLTLSATNPRRRTHIMSILNTTPDSFSDGGSHRPSDIDALKATVADHIAAGATIIDVGGQSSRPGAPDVTAEEEIARVLPAIEAIKALPQAQHIAISVDTYRAQVAEAAVNAGAHVVNDISAGTLDADMLPTVARLGCTYIMMHMRGTPATMNSAENCTYGDGEEGRVWPAVFRELQTRIDAALQAGIRRWRIITDPGIGFAKTQAQNLELLRDLSHLALGPSTFSQVPMLVGTSRKGFIGNITGVKEARERVWGTAATVTAAIRGGVDIVRVHDVAEMAQVAKMSDAIFRIPGHMSTRERARRVIGST